MEKYEARIVSAFTVDDHTSEVLIDIPRRASGSRAKRSLFSCKNWQYWELLTQEVFALLLRT